MSDTPTTETVKPPAPSLYPVASADASPTPRERGSRVAQDLLGTMPDGAVVDDFRIFWPGPVYSVRGHAPPGPGSLAALDEWKKRFDTLRTTDRTPYQVWFKRLEKTPEGNVLAFELLLVPEGLQPPS